MLPLDNTKEQRMIKGILCDLDGTIYRGSDPIPGASAFISRLSSKIIPYLFVTNRANRTPEVICEHVLSLGIPCRPDNILTSAQATANYLQKSSVFYIGEQGLREALRKAQITFNDENPDYVVVGLDRDITYEKIEKAANLIRSGSEFVATNPDKVVNSDKGLSPGNGSIVAAIEAASGKDAVFIGKPNKAIFDTALKRLDLSKDEVLLVGDNLEVDIKGGLNVGLRTALILTGVSTREHLKESSIKPTWVVEGFEALEQIVFDKRTK